MSDLLVAVTRALLAAVAALTALAVSGGVGLALALTYGAVVCVWAVAAVLVALIVAAGTYIYPHCEVTR